MARPRTIEIAERLVELLNDRGVGAPPDPDFLALFTEDAEVVPFRAALEGGALSVEDALAAFAESWSSLVVQIGALRPVGPHVLLEGEIELVGRESGATITRPLVAAIRFDGDRIRRFEPHESSGGAMVALRRAALAASRLYFVCDGLPGGGPPDALLDAALRGGADLIQLREKAPRCAEELIAMAEPFRRAADEHGALFVLNDRPDLVAQCRADGVHVGQDDVPVAEARAAAGPGALVGLSTHSAEQIDAANSQPGAGRPDQISVGPVWETPTKAGRAATGLELVEHAARVSEIPWFAIGGIDQASAPRVVQAGAGRAVVVRAIRDADDPEAAARALRDFLVARAID